MRTAFCWVAKLSLTLATSPSDTVRPSRTPTGSAWNCSTICGLEFSLTLNSRSPMRAMPAGTITLVVCSALTTSICDKPLGAELGRIDVDDDLALLAAVGRRDRQARDGEQLDAQEVEAVVEDLLLGQRLAVERDLHHRHVRGVEADHVRRRDAGRRDAQDRVVLRVDLRDGAADVGALREIDLENAEPGDRQRLDALDAVDRGRIGALADQHDAPFHVLGGEAGIIPGDVDDRDVDVGEDVDDHPLRRQEAHQQDEHAGDRHGVGPSQREANETDHRCLIPRARPLGRIHVGPRPSPRKPPNIRCLSRLLLQVKCIPRTACHVQGNFNP